MTVTTPEAFRRINVWLHQDYDVESGSREAAVEAYIGSLKATELRIVDAYLAELLDIEENRIGLRDTWRKINGDVGFPSTRAALKFFRHVQAQVRAALG